MSAKNIIDLRKAQAARATENPVPVRRAQRSAAVQGRRVSPLKGQRRKWRLALFGCLIAVSFLCAMAVSYASYLPRYSIQEIGVVGARRVSPTLIYTYVETQLLSGTRPFISPVNIFTYNRSGIEAGIVAFFPRIRSAVITRSSLLATAISVAVTERIPFALWCSDDEPSTCYLMDDTGFIFAARSDSPNDALTTPYLFFGGLISATSTQEYVTPIGKRFVSAHVPGILSLLKSLEQSGFHPRSVRVENDQDFTIALADSFRIKASFGENADILIRNLSLILDSDALKDKRAAIEYVDLRFGDRVYYKLLGETEAENTASR